MNLLINPFIYIAGWRSFIYGLVISGLIIYLMYFTGTHFNGLINIEFARNSPLRIYLYEYVINWFSVASLLFVSGLWASRSRIRIIDVLGTTLLARSPLLLVPVVRLLPAFRGLTYTSSPIYILIGLYVLSVIWSIALTFNAFQISCNPRKSARIYLFIIALFIAEIITKISIYKFL